MIVVMAKYCTILHPHIYEAKHTNSKEICISG